MKEILEKAQEEGANLTEIIGKPLDQMEDIPFEEADSVKKTVQTDEL